SVFLLCKARFTSVRVVPLRIRTKIRAAAPPAQRNAGLRVGVISSNGTQPTLENATVLGTKVPVRAAFSKEVQVLLPCMSRTRESIQMNGLSCPCKTRPAQPHICEPGVKASSYQCILVQL
ncbi:unnamed protein product, partial [Staurois parvus]